MSLGGLQQLGGGIQDFGGKLAKPVQQGFGEFYDDPIKWVQSHPISFSQEGPGGGFGVSTKPIAEKYQQQIQEEQLQSLFDPKARLTKNEQMNILATNPATQGDFYKQAIKAAIPVASEFERGVAGMQGINLPPPAYPFPIAGAPGGQPSGRKYVWKGKEVTIPPEKIQAFLRENPNATEVF